MITVLIASDDVSLFDRVRERLLADHPGWDIISAISGPRALGIARSRKPQIVLADGDMIGLDGFQLTEQLQAEADSAHIPVVLLTAEVDESSSARAREAGAVAHLPISMGTDALVERIYDIVGPESEPEPEPEPKPEPEPESAVDPVPEPVRELDPTSEPTAFAQEAASPVRPAPSEPATGYGAPQPTHGGVAAVNSGGASDIPHIDDLLRAMIDQGGSDLHITVGSPPGVRVRGDIIPIEGMRRLMPKDTQTIILAMLSEEHRKRFEVDLELDFAYSIPGLSRFRCNVMQQRNSMGAVFRVVPLAIPTMDELSLPKVCTYLAERPRGLVLVTGPTGSGKSTTLAAMIDHINSTRPVHIITLEDPIEFMHRNKRAYINQREVGEDTHSFAAGLKRVLRQDPDVILVGEMRDLETISAAITAAETGHLVLATLHTTGGPETVDRVIDVFPPHQQQQVRMQLSSTLEGVLSQVLLRSTDGKSRVMAMEIMLGIPAISNLIREGKTHQMPTIIQSGAQLGMQTLDQHLRVLLQAGQITFEEAISKAKEPRELAAMLGRQL